MQESNYISLTGLEIAHLPFPHIISTKVFKDGLDKEIYNWLEKVDAWEFTKTNFYTQYEFSLRGITLPENLKCLVSEASVSYIANKFQESFNVLGLALVDITIHKLLDGHKMGVHNDFLGKDETHRLVIQLNPLWQQKNGGFLMLFNSNHPQDVAKIIQPLNNTAVGFEISQKSYHAVSTVYDFRRYTLVYTFNKTGTCN